MTNPHLFVTGCARSGTTLLQRMLDSHPQLAVSNDTLIIPRSILALDPEADVPLTTATQWRACWNAAQAASKRATALPCTIPQAPEWSTSSSACSSRSSHTGQRGQPPR